MTDSHEVDPQDPARRRLIASAGLGTAAAMTGGAAIAQEGSTLARPLDGQVALVTGAARGIGRATAIELARHGADVALLDIAEPDAIPELRYPLASREDLDEAARLVEAEGATAISIVADIRDSAALRDAVERTEAELGRLHILIANAAIWMETVPGETDMERWQTELDVNLTGTNRTVDAALPALRRQPGGRIVIISSFNARVGSGTATGYSASKWGVTGLMKSLAMALGPDRIAVNCVAPTAVNTVLLREGVYADLDDETMNEQAREGHPLPVGVLQPEAIAGVVAFLSGPEAGFVSGMTLDTNAGRSASLSS